MYIYIDNFIACYSDFSKHLKTWVFIFSRISLREDERGVYKCQVCPSLMLFEDLSATCFERKAWPVPSRIPLASSPMTQDNPKPNAIWDTPPLLALSKLLQTLCIASFSRCLPNQSESLLWQQKWSKSNTESHKQLNKKHSKKDPEKSMQTEKNNEFLNPWNLWRYIERVTQTTVAILCQQPQHMSKTQPIH